ncbi:glycoside hydrolase family 3 protein [Xylariaceae sp. FL0594]|nr:glycoside hydrolase family 3 protein [Xylariaceae sp. FL0594]
MRSSTLLTLQAFLAGSVVASDHVQSPLAYSTPSGKGAGAWADAYARARELVGRMTLEERANITRGYPSTDNTCAGNTGTVPRLNWPGLCVHDAGNGVRAADLVTSFPSALHVGASWDRNLTYQRGLYMGKEFKAKGINNMLGPNAGPLGRTPLGGRNWEGFSVDPYLSGQLVSETIKGSQEAGVMACLKHLIGNEQETYRRPYFGVEAASSNIDDKTLHEYYLWPFVDGVRANVASVMCSYNRVNNTYACMNDKLMNGVLKTELEYDGFVMLDWNARHDVFSANAGLDMVMPSGGSFGKNLTDAVANGTVAPSRVEDMATRIVAAWYLVGQDKDFPAPGIGMKNLTKPHEQVDARIPESREVVLQGAIAGHVLIKNDGALPFKKNPVMLSVYGYDATVPATKNTDTLFQLGYTSSAEMAQAVLGNEAHFAQAARGGTIVTGGRAGANAPSYIQDPLSSLQHRGRADGTWVNWDLTSFDPDVNGASDACLVFINAIATEGWDREGLHDDFSDGLVLNVASKCANTIVVVHAAGVRLVDQWIEHPNVTAAIMAHLPGQDSGEALVRLLYGEAEFSGKLPYTVARNESDYPVYEPCGRASPEDTDPQCDYAEGVYVDYRAFDARNVTPRFEFGFGLSYTSFAYSDLSIELPLLLLDNNDTTTTTTILSDSIGKTSYRLPELFETVARVEARVTNTGHRRGAEVAQLYLGMRDSDSDSPPRQLRGFDKTPILEPRGGGGDAAVVRFDLTRRDFAVWDVVAQAWVVRPGNYTVWVGASSRDLPLSAVIEV